MLYEDIRQGCKEYHRIGSNFDAAYSHYFANKNQNMWNQPDTLTSRETYRLVEFLNRFLCRLAYSSVPILQPFLQDATPYLNRLSSKDILSIDFNERIEVDDRLASGRALIKRCYDRISECPGVGDTVASKILHAINPKLFVMWDDAIIGAYGAPYIYATHFLPEMQRLAKDAINQVIENENRSYDDAIKSLTPCGNTLAKVLDEYNYMKYTRDHPKLVD